MVNETGRKNPKDKALKLALNALGWADDPIREFVSLESLLFMAPRVSRGPWFNFSPDISRVACYDRFRNSDFRF